MMIVLFSNMEGSLLTYMFIHAPYDFLSICTHTHSAPSAATSCVGQPAIVPQTFSLAYNLTGSSAAPSARSGAPGYVVGRPVLAGYAYADPAGTGKTAVLPLASGLRCGGCMI